MRTSGKRLLSLCLCLALLLSLAAILPASAKGGESAPAAESAGNGAGHERVGGLHAHHHERDGQGEADGRSKRGEDRFHVRHPGAGR